MKNALAEVEGVTEGNIDEITTALWEATQQGQAFADIDFSNPEEALPKIANMYNNIKDEGAKAAFMAAVFANTADRDVVTNWIINRIFSDGDIKGTEKFHIIQKDLTDD